MNDTFSDICLKNKTDKQSYHGFCDFYELFFKHLRHKELNILEIGVKKGGSILSLHEYFTNSKIYGMDINLRRAKKIKSDRIFLNKVNQTDISAISTIYKDITFDIIIDDGSHVPEHQITSFNYLFNEKLASGGIYICEDLHTNLEADLDINMLFNLVFRYNDKIDKIYIFKNLHYNEKKKASVTSVIMKGKNDI